MAIYGGLHKIVAVFGWYLISQRKFVEQPNLVKEITGTTVNMINYLRFEVWPAVKTRLIYWWWIVKYRGKKNIPPEVLFGAIDKTIDGLKDNLMQAFRAAPPDMGEEEKKQFFEILSKVKELEKGIGRGKRWT